MGGLGDGKTTLFNKICNKNEEANTKHESNT